MSNVIYKAVSGKVKLPRNCSIQDWIVARYYERFGTDEFIDIVNSWDSDKRIAWWRDNVAENKDWVISLDEFKKWFYEVDLRKPKRFNSEDFIQNMMIVGMTFQPRTIEEANEIKAKNKLINS